jgi:hypothetical protein
MPTLRVGLVPEFKRIVAAILYDAPSSTSLNEMMGGAQKPKLASQAPSEESWTLLP